MQSALFGAFLGIIVLIVVVLAFVALPQIHENEYQQISRELTTEMNLAKDSFETALVSPTKSKQQVSAAALFNLTNKIALRSGARVTVVGLGGVVLADSATPANKLNSLENHANRPEIMMAKMKGKGSSVRYSVTVKKDLIYTAITLKDSKGKPLGYLRFSAPSRFAEILAARIYGSLLAAIILAVIAAVLSSLYFSRAFTAPIANLSKTASRIAAGEYPITILRKSHFEIGELETAVEQMSQHLADNIKTLSAESGKFAALLSSMTEAVLAADPQGKIIFANTVAEKVFGVLEPEIMGKSIREALKNNEIAALIEMTLQSGEKQEGEVSLYAPSSATFAAQAAPIINSLGQKQGAVCVLYDITKIRQLENYRSEFVANVSHELKTPLTAIRSYVETLEGGALEDPAHNREFLGIINKHSANLSTLIDDILEISRLESKKELGPMLPIDLSMVAHHAQEAIAPKAKQKGVLLETEIAEGLMAKGIEDHLFRALLNLLDNAVKYTDSGKKITLSVARDADQVVIKVADEGLGIPADKLPRIFERFYRVDPARSRELGGTGLGLAIVKHVVEVHGGKVEVESVEGQGSTFIIRLPISS